MKKVLALTALLAGSRLLLRRRFDWSNRVVLIAGGSRGLGLLLARRIGKKGARLVLAARDAAELERARDELEEKGIDVEVVVTDVADREQAQAMVEAAVARFGRLDVLINAASIISVAPLEALSLEDFQDAVNVNFWGTVYATLSALPYLKEAEGARIVNISSIGGLIAVPHLLPYSCGKFAVTGFSEGIQAELAGTGIHVTTVVPGLMRTGSAGHALVKGQQETEATLFALAGSLPAITVSAERAASRIVRGMERGERWITIGVITRAAMLIHALAPGLTGFVLRGTSSFLPEAPAGSAETSPEEAREHPTKLSESFLTRLGRRAAARNNEISI